MTPSESSSSIMLTSSWCTGTLLPNGQPTTNPRSGPMEKYSSLGSIRLNAPTDLFHQYVIKHGLTENPEPTWRAMEALYCSGKARAIGVSNFTIPRLQQLLSFASVPPAVNQVEIHPFLPNQELLDFATSKNILLVAYSPLGSQNQVPRTGEKVSENKTLNEVAERSGHTLAQTLIAWGIKRGYPVLPKSATPSRIKSNFEDYELNDKDYQAVNEVAKGRHCRFVNMKDTFGFDLWPEEAE